MKLFVLSKSKEGFSNFCKYNDWLPYNITPLFVSNSRNYASLINEAVDTGEVSLIALENIIVPRGFPKRLADLIKNLNDTYLNWGVVSNAGISINANLKNDKLLKYFVDESGVQNWGRGIWPASAIGGSVYLLNGQLLKKKARNNLINSLDEIAFFSLAVDSIENGCSNYIADALLVAHDETVKQELNKNRLDQRTYEYLDKTFSGEYIDLFQGRVYLKSKQKTENWVDKSLNAIKSKLNVSLAIVVRTQFKRELLLSRCLSSINSFVASAGDYIKINTYLVTDSEPSKEIENKRIKKTNIKIIPCHLKDTRFELVYGALKSIEEDYVWFVDDDDFLFPNLAERICKTISVYELGKTFYVDTQYFNESFQGNSSFPTACPGKILSGSKFIKNRYLMVNHIAFSGVIFSRKNLLNELTERYMDNLCYLEDFLCQLLVMKRQDYSPVVINALGVGISLRKNDTLDQTVTKSDRSEWNRSRAELCSIILEEFNPLFFLSDEKGTLPVLARNVFEKNNRKSRKLSQYAHRVRDAIRILRGKKLS